MKICNIIRGVLYDYETVSSMKETSRRRITVTSSLNEISTDQLRNRVVTGGGITPIPFYSRLLDGIFKDDVNVFPPPRIFPSRFFLTPYTCIGGGFIIGGDIGLFFSVWESV
jgi:hypothetical protein